MTFDAPRSLATTKYEARQAISKLRTGEKASTTKDVEHILTDSGIDMARLFPSKIQPMVGAKAVMIACYAKAIEQLFQASDPSALLAVKEACKGLGIAVPAAVLHLQAEQNKRDRGNKFWPGGK